MLWAKAEMIAAESIEEETQKEVENLALLIREVDHLKDSEETVVETEIISSHGFQSISKKDVIVENSSKAASIIKKKNDAGDRVVLLTDLRDKIRKKRVEYLKQGISIIAVLPIGLWENITSKYFYRFENLSKDGYTGINNDLDVEFLFSSSLYFIFMCAVIATVLPVLGYSSLRIIGSFILMWPSLYLIINAFEKTAKLKWILMAIIGISSSYALFISSELVLDKFSSVPTFFFVITTIIVFLVLCVVGLIVFAFIGFKVAPKIWEILGIRFFPARYCFPNKIDTPSKGSRIRIKFIHDPGPDFVRRIQFLKEAEKHPCIAAERGAFVFDKESLFRSPQNLDPIIYTIEDDLVVVHMQHGDFSKEKEVINWLNNEGYSQFLRLIK